MPALIYSQDEATLYERAEKAFLSQQYKEAIDLFDDYLYSFGQSLRAPNAQYNIGESFYRCSRFNQALEAFRRVVTLYPDHPLATQSQLRMGDCYQKIGEEGLARKAYQMVIEQHPNTIEADYARYNLGQTSSAPKPTDPTTAIGTTSTTPVKSIPTTKTSSGQSQETSAATELLEEAKSLFKIKDYQDAGKKFQEFLAKNPRHPDSSYAQLKIGECYYYQQNYKEAIKWYEGVIKNYSESKYAEYAYYSLGWSYYHLDQYPEAWTAFTTLKKNYPKSSFISSTDEILSRVEVGIAKQLYENATKNYEKGQLQEARTGFQKLIATYPKTSYAKDAQKILENIVEELQTISYPAVKKAYEHALSLYQAKKYDAAKEEAQKIITDFPESEYVQLAQKVIAKIEELTKGKKVVEKWQEAMQHYNEGEFTRAETLFKEIINQYPESEYAKKSLIKVNEISELSTEEGAYTLYKDALTRVKKGDFLGAQEIFRKLTSLYPDSPYLHLAEQGINDTNKAIRNLKAERYYDIGTKYVELECYEDAKRQFQRIIDFYQDTPCYEKAKEALAKIAAESKTTK